MGIFASKMGPSPAMMVTVPDYLSLSLLQHRLNHVDGLLLISGE